MTITPDVLDALRDALPTAEVCTDPALLAELSADSSPRSKKATTAARPLATADLVVRVSSTEDVVATVRWARENGIPVLARGGGSGVVGSGLPIRGGVVIDMSGLNHVGEVNVTDRLVTVGAGLLGSDLEEALQPHGLATGHYPQSFHLASVGGWVTMRGSGTFSSLYGNIEDRVADLEVVLPTGEVLRTKSIPRASQGPDLKQLFIGSEGTLGIITSVTLRLVPLPEDRRFNSLHFTSFDGALDTAREMLRSGVRPAVLRIYDPIESTAKHARFAEGDGWLMILAFDGNPELTSAQEQITLEIAGAHGATILGEQPGIAWEQRRFDWSWFTDNVEKTGGIAEAIEISAPWSELAALYTTVTTAAASAMDQVMGHVSHIYDQGASLYVISSGHFDDDEAALQAYDKLWDAVMTATISAGAQISHHHGIGLERSRWMTDAVGDVAMSTLKRVKNALDPAAIMNPGKLGI